MQNISQTPLSRTTPLTPHSNLRDAYALTPTSLINITFKQRLFLKQNISSYSSVSDEFNDMGLAAQLRAQKAIDDVTNKKSIRTASKIHQIKRTYLQRRIQSIKTRKKYNETL